MRVRVAIVAALMVGGLTACGGQGSNSANGTDGTGTLGDASASAAATTTAATATSAVPTSTPTDTTGHSAGNPLSCAQLPNAVIGSASKPLADYTPGAVQLSGGTYTGPDSTVIELQPACAIGDLNADGVFDAMGVVKITAGGTGRFYTLVAWTSNNSGTPQLAASKAVGDRNPVQSITIAGNQATVVYLTRTPDVPLAGLNLRRTAIYRLTGGALVELSHVDGPYTP